MSWSHGFVTLPFSVSYLAEISGCNSYLCREKRAKVDSSDLSYLLLMARQALPRLTNREKVVEMVDPALRGQFSKKELIQV